MGASHRGPPYGPHPHSREASGLLGAPKSWAWALRLGPLGRARMSCGGGGAPLLGGHTPLYPNFFFYWIWPASAWQFDRGDCFINHYTQLSLKGPNLPFKYIIKIIQNNP